MIDQQFEYWASLDPVHKVFNDQAREQGYYWIDVCHELENNLIRVAHERPPFLSHYHVPFDPPYFVIPHFLLEAFNGITIRSIDGEENRQIGKKVGLYTCENGVHQSEQFNYQKPVVLCEGPMDAEYIGQHYPFTMAVKSTKPSSVEKDLLNAMTRQIIWVPDNDDSGQESIDWFKYNMDAEIMKPPSTVKDCGDLFYEDGSVFNLKLKQKVGA